MINKKNIHPLILNNIINWIIQPKKNLQYFGHFLSKMVFEETDRIKTMAVTVSKNGFKLLYNINFIESITEEEVRFILLHEIFHCIDLHLVRIKKYDRNVANYAMDMVVNRQATNIKNTVNEEIIEPENIIKLPNEYNGPIVFESIYEWLMNNKDRKDHTYFETEQMFDNLKKGEYFDEHFDLQSFDITEEEFYHKLNKINKEIQNELKGDIPGIVKDLIHNIKKRKENPVKLLKNLMSDAAYSSKRRTFRKLNRKGIPGFKGNIKTGMSFNCIADVSGSMKDVLKEVIGIITNSMLHMNLIKVDTIVQSHEVYEKASDLKKLNFKGCGGTILQPGIDYIAKNKTLNKNGTIIITDGYIDKLDLSKLNEVILVYTSLKPTLYQKSKKYREIKIEI